MNKNQQQIRVTSTTYCRYVIACCAGYGNLLLIFIHLLLLLQVNVSLLFLKKPPGMGLETSKINKQASVERSV